MLSQGSANGQPFWRDEPDLYSARPLIARHSTQLIINLLGVLFALPILIVPALILMVVSPSLALLWIILAVSLTSLSYYQMWRRKRLTTEITELQERARLRVGAAYMDSAIHIAGHPFLARDQSIVLGLQGDTLSFYTYENPTPIDSLSVRQLQAIHTVVYDDERVPHVDVVDNAGQALQLTFTREGETWTCLFRRMRKVRPVDWYHAIQQARLLVSPASQPAA